MKKEHFDFVHVWRLNWNIKKTAANKPSFSINQLMIEGGGEWKYLRYTDLMNTACLLVWFGLAHKQPTTRLAKKAIAAGSCGRLSWTKIYLFHAMHMMSAVVVAYQM